MKKLLQKTFVPLCVVFILCSCSSMPGVGGKQVQGPLQPLSCIAVLPATTSVDKDETIVYQEARALEKGAAYATSVMAVELAGNPKVRVLNSAQVSTIIPEVSGGISGTIAVLGEKVNCDGVLLTTVRRFKQREGTELAVDSPASVNFRMSLRQASSGTVLWSADFRETQESFLANIFSYDKAQKRGFKWISVEQLMEQGIKERLAECPYLK